MQSALNEVKLGNYDSFCHSRNGSYEDLIGTVLFQLSDKKCNNINGL